MEYYCNFIFLNKVLTGRVSQHRAKIRTIHQTLLYQRFTERVAAVCCYLLRRVAVAAAAATAELSGRTGIGVGAPGSVRVCTPSLVDGSVVVGAVDPRSSGSGGC